MGSRRLLYRQKQLAEASQAVAMMEFQRAIFQSAGKTRFTRADFVKRGSLIASGLEHQFVIALWSAKIRRDD
jgi:hypothetical protein